MLEVLEVDKIGEQMGQVAPTSQNLRDYIERDIPEENMINSANMCQKITHQSDFLIFISLKKKKTCFNRICLEVIAVCKEPMK